MAKTRWTHLMDTLTNPPWRLPLPMSLLAEGEPLEARDWQSPAQVSGVGENRSYLHTRNTMGDGEHLKLLPQAMEGFISDSVLFLATRVLFSLRLWKWFSCNTELMCHDLIRKNSKSHEPVPTKINALNTHFTIMWKWLCNCCLYSLYKVLYRYNQ